MQQVKIRLAVGVLVALTGFQWSDPLAVGNGLSPSANVMVLAGMPKTGLPPYTRSSVTPWSVMFSDSGLAAGANARFTGKPLSATCSVSWAKARRASPLPWPYIVIFTGAPISQATKSTRTANADGEVRLIWLGALGGSTSRANAVSTNGWVVGYSYDAAENRRAFRWTASGGMQGLGTLGGRWSEAYGVSSDGSVVVGKAGTSSELRRLWVGAFRWTTSGGMQDLNKVYAGALSSDGSILREARAVSPNGGYIVGIGLTEGKRYLQAFLLDAGVPVP